ncbi:hypothetical protein L9F63_018629, partial [Diploptera punctata]
FPIINVKTFLPQLRRASSVATASSRLDLQLVMKTNFANLIIGDINQNDIFK